MARFSIICVGLIYFSQAFALANIPVLAMSLFPVGVAYYWAASLRGRAWILVGCAAFVPLTFSIPFGDRVGMAMVYALVALTGVGIGVVLIRRWSYGWCVTWLSLMLTGLMAAGMLSDWEASRKNLALLLSEWERQINAAAKETGNTAYDAMNEMVSWLDVNWEFIFLGLLFGWVLLGTTFLVGVLSRILRLRGVLAGPKNSFISMRTSEWLVWAAIGIAVLWFIERQLSLPWLRMITWNAGIALVFVYWLNGFSILLYSMIAVRVRLLLFVMAVTFVFVALSTTAPVLVMLGLFDTWWDVRLRVHEIVARRDAG